MGQQQRSVITTRPNRRGLFLAGACTLSDWWPTPTYVPTERAFSSTVLGGGQTRPGARRRPSGGHTRTGARRRPSGGQTRPGARRRPSGGQTRTGARRRPSGGQTGTGARRRPNWNWC